MGCVSYATAQVTVDVAVVCPSVRIVSDVFTYVASIVAYAIVCVDGYTRIFASLYITCFITSVIENVVCRANIAASFYGTISSAGRFKYVTGIASVIASFNVTIGITLTIEDVITFPVSNKCDVLDNYSIVEAPRSSVGECPINEYITIFRGSRREWNILSFAYDDGLNGITSGGVKFHDEGLFFTT